MQITVAATAESKQAPTRATVQARVLTQGPDAATATSRTQAASATVSSAISDLASTKSVEKWSQDALTTWSSRPWKDDGTQGDPVFYASVNFHATFTNFAELAQWLVSVGEHNEVEVQSVSWELSPEEEAEVEALVRAEAVQAAREKALTYAQAAGYSAVVFEEIADAGLLGNPGQFVSESVAVMGRSAMFKDVNGLEVRPEDVTVSASVHARFSSQLA